MFLYFYEDNLIAGLDYNGTFFPNITDAGEFDMNDENSCKKLYDAWMTEENGDGTFYLVFIFDNKKYYLTSYQNYETGIVHVYLIEETNIREKSIYYHKLKMIYDEEGNILAQKQEFEPRHEIMTFTKLHIVKKNNKYYMLLTDPSHTNNNEFYNKLCLTTSNKKEYTIK